MNQYNTEDYPRSAGETRRSDTDRRRSLSAINLHHLGLQARRQGQRRDSDAQGHYVDWYDARLLFLAVGIVVCCCLDAFFTLNLLQMGAMEMNALMASLIETDVRTFVQAKVAITCLSVTLLIIHKNYRVIKGVTVEHLLLLVFAAYVALIGYELSMLANPPI